MSKTNQKHYILFRSFAADLLKEIEEDGVNHGTDEIYYTTLLVGFMSGVSAAFNLDKSELSNMHTECDQQVKKIKELIHRINKEDRYEDAVDSIRRKFSDCQPAFDNFEKILEKASADEIIELDYIRYHSLDCTGEEFYDKFEELEQKYL